MIPPGIMFNFCAGAPEEEMESALSKLSGDAKLMGAVDTVPGWVMTRGFQPVGIDELTGAWWNSTRTNALPTGRKSLLQAGHSVANVHSSTLGFTNQSRASSPRKGVIPLHSALRSQTLYGSFGPLIHKRLTNHSVFKEGHQCAQGWSSCLVQEHGGIVQPKEVAAWRGLRLTSSIHNKVIKV